MRYPPRDNAGSTESYVLGRDAKVIAESGSFRNQHFYPRHSYRPLTAADLDRIADLEIGHGHHARAEQLSHRAEQMRAEGGG